MWDKEQAISNVIYRMYCWNSSDFLPKKSRKKEDTIKKLQEQK